MKLSEELEWRGFKNQTTFKDTADLDKTKRTFYLGVDPSAKSMTIGNLAVVMLVRHFVRAGHKAVVLVGGATGMIGDPDGKSEERDLKTIEELEENVKGIKSQYKKLLGDMDFEVVNNYDWFKELNYLQFLRDVGKHVPMRQMVNRDFVKTRLSEDGAGISYAEFSYSLIQGYDFLHLYREHGVSLQIAGSDQWGNSIAGVELIRRVEGAESHVWTAPLVINKATGKKFGKTEGGAVWLDEDLTSVFKFYQFWLNVDDEGVKDYLKIYTEISKEKLVEVLNEFKEKPYQRLAQKTLAYEVTKLVHGKERADTAVRLTEVLFGKAEFSELEKSEKELLRNELTVTNKTDITEALLETGLAASKTEANRLISDGAVSLNGNKLSSIDDLQIENGLNLLRKGKNNFALIDNK